MILETFIDRTILFIAGILITVMTYKSKFDVAYLLIGVTIFAMTYINESSGHANINIYMSVAATLILYFAPYIIFFVPIMVHGVICEKRCSKSIKIMGLGLILAIVSGGLAIYYDKIFDLNLTVIIAMFFIIAILLGIKSHKIYSVNQMLKRQRDDYVEYENDLKNQNETLEKNTANEIHIATLAERNRIAREIHDNVGHMLSRSILQTGALMAIHKGEPVEKELEGLSETLNAAMNNIRESVHDLHKDSFDINEAAKKVICELEKFEVKYECDISNDIDKDLKYDFISILSEAVTNINKYSNAKNVKIIIRELEEYYQMLIEDDGVNMKSFDGVHAGIGIKNMQDRIRKHSGIINITTNNGFRIYISVPKVR